jgi:hypothetical protein
MWLLMGKEKVSLVATQGKSSGNSNDNKDRKSGVHP